MTPPLEFWEATMFDKCYRILRMADQPNSFLYSQKCGEQHFDFKGILMRPNLKSGRVCYTLGLLSFHRILVSWENCNPLIKVGWWKIEKVSYTLSLLMKTDFPFNQTNLSESESPFRPQNSIWRSKTGSNRYFPKTTINKCKDVFISAWHLWWLSLISLPPIILIDKSLNQSACWLPPPAVAKLCWDVELLWVINHHVAQFSSKKMKLET